MSFTLKIKAEPGKAYNCLEAPNLQGAQKPHIHSYIVSVGLWWLVIGVVQGDLAICTISSEYQW